jgi:hypothetical protein
VSDVPETVEADDEHRVDIATLDRQPREIVCETFTGPALTFTLADPPEPGTVAVSGPDGNGRPVTTDGRTVKRDQGHFGRGRWTVHYEPA